MSLLANATHWQFITDSGMDAAIPCVATSEGKTTCGDTMVDLGDNPPIKPEISTADRLIFDALAGLHPKLNNAVAKDAFVAHAINIAAASRFDCIESDLWREMAESMGGTLRSLAIVPVNSYAEIHIVGYEPLYVFVTEINDRVATTVTINPISDNACNIIAPSYRAQKIPTSLLLPAKMSRATHYGHLPNIEDVPIFY